LDQPENENHESHGEETPYIMKTRSANHFGKNMSV